MTCRAPRRPAFGNPLRTTAPLLLLLALTLVTSGCFTVAAAIGCGGTRPASEPHRQSDCDQIEDAAGEIDDAIFDEVTESRRVGSLVAVEVQGRVTDEGLPLAEAAVRLLHDESILAIVHSDGSGAYALSALVEPDECESLRLEVADPEEVWGRPVAPTCGAWTLDYDVTTEAWVTRRAPQRSSEPRSIIR